MKKIYFIICSSLVLLVLIGGLLTSINELFETVEVDNNYSYPVIKEVTQQELEVTTDNFVKPFKGENINIDITYYEDTGSKESQENSLIYYENTYMPSTGIFYSADTDFEVVSVYDGVVTDIKDDNILGTYVEITHNNNLTTIYYSLKEVCVNINDEITTGTVIGKSNSNKITNKSSILFEVYNNGKIINPEIFYVSTIKEYE